MCKVLQKQLESSLCALKHFKSKGPSSGNNMWPLKGVMDGQ